METEPLPVRSAVDERMRELGIPSYAELANEAGVDADTVTAVLDGRSTRPHRRTRLGLASALYWDPDWLEYLRRGEAPPEAGIIDLDDSGSTTYRTAADLRQVAAEDVRRLEEYHRSRLVYESVARVLRLMDVTMEALEKLGWKARDTQDPDQPDLIALPTEPGGSPRALVIEVKTLTPGSETDAVSSALGKLLLYRGDEWPADDPLTRLLLITDYPLEDHYLERLTEHGVHHAWPGDWSAVRRSP